ncbi:MAG: nitrite/sulfite reductase [Acidobacteria bacterium]|nr:nitrite/sulfite reductase [Acidobacteriota bacterium]
MYSGETTPTDTSLLLPETARELDNFEAEMNRYLRGELSPERWRGFRLAHGIYGQRQPDVQMIRVKIPSGALTGRQLRRLADLSKEFSTGVCHLTTRQDVQFHFVRLSDVPTVMRRLAAVGLTTREACGNSVRNVTACPLTGFIAEELFDVQPYSLATYAYLVRNPFCQQMSRKFKIAFSSCPEDCAATAIHDIGLLGRVLEEDGRSRYGFRVLVGGGLGSTPFTAQLLDDFVPLEDLLPTLKAILEVFTDHGNRRSKMKARLKFVVHKMGIETFRGAVAAAKRDLAPSEREEASLRRYVPLRFDPIVTGHLEGRPALAEIRSAQTRSAATAFTPSGSDGDEDFERWLSCSVRPHQDPERAVVTILFPLGDMEAGRLRTLSRIVTAFGEDHARVARDQNLVLPSALRSDLRALYDALLSAGAAEVGVGTALDVTACPGADTCGLGITSSKGLTRVLRETLAPLASNGGLEDLRGITIKISGCPNSCGQHHIANIGFHGVVKTVAGRQVPAYQLHLGGRIGCGEARIGKALDKIPARNIPGVVSALLTLYRDARGAGESFADFVARLPGEKLSATLKSFVEALPPEEDLTVDWGQEEPFSTDDMGKGECAGAGTDVAVGPFDNYRGEILQASLFMDRGQWVDAVANLNRSQYTLARILLESLGKHPDSDYETTCEIRAQIIDRGHSSERWNDFHREIGFLLRTRRPDPDAVRRAHRLSLDLLEESKGTLAILEQKKSLAVSADVAG